MVGGVLPQPNTPCHKGLEKSWVKGHTDDCHEAAGGLLPAGRLAEPILASEGAAGVSVTGVAEVSGER